MWIIKVLGLTLVCFIHSSQACQTQHLRFARDVEAFSWPAGLLVCLLMCMFIGQMGLLIPLKAVGPQCELETLRPSTLVHCALTAT